MTATLPQFHELLRDHENELTVSVKLHWAEGQALSATGINTPASQTGFLSVWRYVKFDWVSSQPLTYVKQTQPHFPSPTHTDTLVLPSFMCSFPGDTLLLALRWSLSLSAASMLALARLTNR